MTRETAGLWYEEKQQRFHRLKWSVCFSECLCPRDSSWWWMFKDDCVS
jgi:hypothetical protein